MNIVGIAAAVAGSTLNGWVVVNDYVDEATTLQELAHRVEELTADSGVPLTIRRANPVLTATTETCTPIVPTPFEGAPPLDGQVEELSQVFNGRAYYLRQGGFGPCALRPQDEIDDLRAGRTTHERRADELEAAREMLDAALADIRQQLAGHAAGLHHVSKSDPPLTRLLAAAAAVDARLEVRFVFDE